MPGTTKNQIKIESSVGQFVHIKQDASRGKQRMENIVQLIESRDTELHGT